MDITYLLEKYPDKPWDWYRLSYNSNITMKDVLNNPDKPWDWSGLSYNKNITMNDILNNPDQPWDWSCLSLNKNITIKDILNNPDKPWDWSDLSNNKHITMKDVLNNPDKPWDWSGLSQNSNITIEFIEKNINKIDFSCLSSNTFIDKEPFLELLNIYKNKKIFRSFETAFETSVCCYCVCSRSGLDRSTLQWFARRTSASFGDLRADLSVKI